MVLWQLWIVTSGLLTVSLIVIVVLAMRRVVLDASERRRRLRRKELVHRLLPLLSRSHANASLHGLDCDRHLLADVGCELLALVRGEEQMHYAEVLSQLGVKEALLERLAGASGEQRVSAAEAIAAFPDADAAGVISRLLSDHDPEVRIAAAVTIVGRDPDVELKGLLRHLGPGETTSRRTVQLFEGAARHRPEAVLETAMDPSMDLLHRMAAIEALGALRELAAAKPLLQLAGPMSKLQAVSIRALGAIGHPIAKDVVASGLYNPDWEVRAESAEAAGRIGLTQTIGRLGELLDDSNWWVRLRAGNALMANGRSGEDELLTLAEC